MEKLCITPKDSPKDVDAIEKDIEQLWSLLEITLEILDELCVVYVKNGEEANKQAAMEEGKMLESEIQTAIEKAHEAVKSHAQISVATASHSEFCSSKSADRFARFAQPNFASTAFPKCSQQSRRSRSS